MNEEKHTKVSGAAIESEDKRRWWRSVGECALFVLLVAMVSQILYAHLGFMPMDEGYMLSGSRRLLDGQIPHRDYISLRPVLTQVLHAHFLLWGGERLMWWSRLAPLVQLALAAWLWTALLRRSFGVLESAAVRWYLSFASFVASVHTFPLMPWNSIDGFFFLSVGLACHQLGGARGRWLGLFCMGLAPLTRQNFLIVIPLLVLVLGEGMRPKAWLPVFLPSICYGAFLGICGALPDALMQVTSHGSYYSDALFGFFGTYFRISGEGLLVGLVAGLLAGPRRNVLCRQTGAVILFLSAAYMLYSLPLYYAGMAHAWFALGAVVGMAPLVLRGAALRVAALAMIVAWAVSMSAGYPSPALGSGALLAILVATAGLVQKEVGPVSLPRMAPWLAGALFLLAAAQYHEARTLHVYFEWPAPLLKHDLGPVLRGAEGIRTNPNTYAYVSAIDEAVKWARQARPDSVVGMVPEEAQFWVTYPQENPLSSDWPIWGETVKEAVKARVQREVIASRGHAVFVVAKYEANTLPFRPTLSRPGFSPAVDTIREHFRLIRDEPLYAVYE